MSPLMKALKPEQDAALARNKRYPVANQSLSKMSLPEILRALTCIYPHDNFALIVATKAVFSRPDNNEVTTLYTLLDYLDVIVHRAWNNVANVCVPEVA